MSNLTNAATPGFKEPPRREPVHSSGAVAYEHADIPEGMTLAAWRRGRAHRHARRHRAWLHAERDRER